VFLAFIAAFFSSVMYLTNQYFKLPGEYIVIWSRVFILIALTPVMINLEWPTEPIFYLCVIVTGFFASFADIKSFNICARYGGGVALRIQPLMVWLSFFLWVIVDPGIIDEYIEDPLRSLGVFMALGGCVYFASRLKRCKISHAVMKAMVLPLIGYSMNNVLNKIAMDNSPLHSGVYGHMFVQSVTAVILTIIFMLVKNHRSKQDVTIPGFGKKIVIIAGFIGFIGWAGHMIPKNYAMTFTPNPAYIAAIILTAPVWATLVYKFIGHKETADVKTGFGVVISSIILALLMIS